MMEHVHFKVDDVLRDHGFISLSGEGCGIGLRRHYDLTPEAVDIFTEFLGGCTPTYPNMNYSRGQTHSMMLPYDLMRSLAIFCLLVDGYDAVASINYRKNAREPSIETCPNCKERIHIEKREGWPENHLYAYSGDINYSNPLWAKQYDLLNKTYNGRFNLYMATGTARGGRSNQHVFTGRIP